MSDDKAAILSETLAQHAAPGGARPKSRALPRSGLDSQMAKPERRIAKWLKLGIAKWLCPSAAWLNVQPSQPAARARRMTGDGVDA